MKEHTRGTVRYACTHQIMLENCAVMECSLKDASTYTYALLKLKSVKVIELLDVQGLLCLQV
jgi:hypothetical protein